MLFRSMDGKGNMVFIAKKERVQNPNYEKGSGDWKKLILAVRIAT